ncbi:glycoside hydrolase family 18 protein [Aspergillus homomorphus CBS 101889]|uniref:chitinase n=1 Tax=Aspergillus homomorphus (strain CBS 101889) TaxID=1450537 RepID=A0A395HZ89_ASPHC|nr:glycoside hydrolase family 18 protein [Aspergillus homomorphus CBS 101889]RAL13110.1 glycoside hydrolase family 18 protein [Aspergillus homomorphus CBS 101889]
MLDPSVIHPGYQGRSVFCPARCAASGPNPGNRSLYHNFEQLASCEESLFYSFSFSDPVDDPDSFHRIYTCTSFGPDWATLPVNTSNLALQSKEAPAPVNGTYQIGSWPSSEGLSVSPSLATLVKQFRQYLSNGFGAVNHPTIIFASYGSTSVGLYVGQGLQSQGVGDVALAYLERSIAGSNASLGASVTMQFRQPGQTSHHIFGLMATGNGTFAAVQDALTSWSKAECLAFPSVQNVTGRVPLATPLYSFSSNASNISVNLNSNSTYASPDSISSVRRRRSLAPRTTCSTAQVVSGDTCTTLAEKCGITPAQFTKYNSESKECSSLVAGEHVCCSAGTLPDFASKPQSDGTGATYTVQPNDSCVTIAAAYGLTIDDINNFNTGTWAWNTCSRPLYAHEVICLSEGNPPMPASVSNAICGPQVPGTPTPPSGTNCGVTAEFCTNTGTGAPGTAAKGTEGCISNCGTEMVRSSPPATYRSIGYYEGFNLQRPCLYQDVSQIDTSAYTHNYFSFGVLSSSYMVQIPHKTTLFEFTRFKQIRGAKRILSIGGWAFSTDPSTYMIFREGVTAANRLTMATNIANFIKEHDLDGVNIDWEYPGAPDIPGIPPASPDDGDNYHAFLAILRNLLHDREVTIAAPSSYWYVKGFPIKKMAPLLDYIIYMTYDLHGQWDAHSDWSQLGCPTGNCLRSDPGPCTQSPGYIANAEIEAILADRSRVTQSYIDIASDSNILVYDDTQWVGWMSDGIKASRRSLYKGLAMGGTTDWATDLQKDNPPPYPAKSWAGVIDDVVLDKDPYVEGNRTGNWTSLTCSDPAMQDVLYMPCAQRWSELDASDAWSDAIGIWENIDKQKLTGSNDEKKFSYSLMNTFHVGESTNCGLVAPGGSCSDSYPCSVFEGFGSGGSGPAAMMYSQFFDAISVAAGTYIDNQLQDFESTFAPVPPAPSDEWLVILTNLLGLGLTAVAAPYFDGVFESLPALSSVLGEAGADTAKDISNAAVAFGAAIASAAIPEGEQGHWTAHSQESFTATLGSVVSGWANVTQNQLWNLFNGSETSIALLTRMIANGDLIEGSSAAPSVKPSTTPETTTQSESSIDKAFFGFAIPSVWAVSGAAAFVVDSGYPCSAQNPLSDYMTAATQEATYSCYNDKLYYLVRRDLLHGAPGLSSLGGGAWGGITLDDLIKGSVRTYAANGNVNGGPVANPLDPDTLQDLSNQDITTPGYIRLPVCSPQVAWASWSNPSQSNASAPNYPCNPLQGVTKCSGYTYVDQTTPASPLVSDCKTIIHNIQGTGGHWTTGIDRQRAIATYGSCKFGVQNVGVTGDVTYYTGSQDIVTIITEAIAKYEWEGRVGAKGYMECDGDAGHQKVK